MSCSSKKVTSACSESRAFKASWETKEYLRSCCSVRSGDVFVLRKRSPEEDGSHTFFFLGVVLLSSEGGGGVAAADEEEEGAIRTSD